MDGQECVELFYTRNSRALSEAAEQYGTYCKSVALNILRSEPDAEECVNDALMRAWENIPPDRPDSLKAYLGSITRNLALDRLRASRAGKRGAGSEPLPIDELSDLAPSELNVESELELSELRQRLNAFVGSLDPESRAIFVRRYWYMQEIAEIAEQCGIGKSKVKMRLLRTRSKLREYLKKEGYDL
ncbi:MAG: sigma-70 family RNA polymerase sigma factor [Ruminococcus sp.]|nr:sigma-70 family RNA polymerase sigma factor [Ruminococcus sp.]